VLAARPRVGAACTLCLGLMHDLQPVLDPAHARATRSRSKLANRGDRAPELASRTGAGIITGGKAVWASGPG
jgi:hypothetical protein